MQKFDCPHCHRIFESDPGENEVVLCPHCNSTVALPEEDLPPGTIIGGFEIIRLLGHGGMGNVYLANQISMNRPVALKILLKSMTQDKESVKQFLNEVRVSGKLNHRNIITAIDAGEIDDTYFLVTTFVDGLDLERRLEEDRILPEKEALRITLKVADALKYAWENHGILHKDIKPGNIMLDSKGEVYLMDMGIAQFIGDAPSQDEHILGSPFFMSPEQTRGARLSWSSDLYSLGATLYNMVVGVPPYDADDVMKIIEMHSNAPFPPPSKRNPDARVSRPTIDLLKRMMGKKPDDRFDSWGGLQEEIKKVLRVLEKGSKGKTGSAKKQTGPVAKGKKTPPAKRGRRRRAVPVKKSGGNGASALIVSLALVLVACGAAYFFYKKNLNDNAKAYLDRAEDFYRNNPGSYYASLQYFREAVDNAHGTDYENTAVLRCAEMKREANAQERYVQGYEDAKVEVARLMKQKNYAGAVSVLKEAVKNIKSTLIQRDAAERIKQLEYLQKKSNIFSK